MPARAEGDNPRVAAGSKRGMKPVGEEEVAKVIGSELQLPTAWRSPQFGVGQSCRRVRGLDRNVSYLTSVL